MASYTLLISTVCVFWCVISAELCIPISHGYYWRDYDGELPHDAIPGGLQNGLKKTYVGQTVHSHLPHLIPGEIRLDSKQLYFELGGPHIANRDNVKILCTAHPERYHWVKTSIEQMKTLDRGCLVKGGFEGLPLYIGRGNIGVETVVGKINNPDMPDKSLNALWIAHNGVKHHFFKDFEVLMYNPETPENGVLVE